MVCVASTMDTRRIERDFADPARRHLVGCVTNWLPFTTTYPTELFVACERADKAYSEAKAASQLVMDERPRGDVPADVWAEFIERSRQASIAASAAYDVFSAARRAFTEAVVAGIAQ